MYLSNMALFLASIILDAKHGKSVRENQDFFFRFHLKLSSYTRSSLNANSLIACPSGPTIQTVSEKFWQCPKIESKQYLRKKPNNLNYPIILKIFLKILAESPKYPRKKPNTLNYRILGGLGQNFIFFIDT